MEMLSNLTLPPEIIEEILSWLPVKSICRFRCVSKPWKALFSKPEFIKTHLSRAKQLQRESLLFCSVSDRLYSASLSNVKHLSDNMTALAWKELNFDLDGCYNRWFDIVASCDGLVLVYHDDSGWYLINPTTQEIKFVNRECNEDPDLIMWGLGYDIVRDDYKIFSRTNYVDEYDEDDEEPLDDYFFLYSVRSNTWKNLGFEHGYPRYGVFLHGYMHWLADKSIAAFHVAEERLCEVPSPSSVDNYDDLWSNNLVVLGGCLCMIYESPHEAHIWMMKEYGVKESWTKVPFVLPETVTNGCLFLYLLGQEQVLATKCEQKAEWQTEAHRKAITFVESLISPYSSNEMRRRQGPTVEELLDL